MIAKVDGLDIPRYWYRSHLFGWLLSPLSYLYRMVIAFRHQLYQWRIYRITQLPVPVIVVGNITVGGTGKTPLVAWLAQWLIAQGYRPGLISRGYKGENRQPVLVTPDSDPASVGDEAVMLAQQTQCPMMVGHSRVAAAQTLLQHDPSCNILISDDGLQHYALGRDIEIAVVDGINRFGNGFCLPAGPLRDPITRLKTVDYVVVNGGIDATMQYCAGAVYQLIAPQRTLSAEQVVDKPIHAVAGIGHPQRFFALLKRLGFNVIPHAFPDHHAFVISDFNFGADDIIIMTEKDAVKCRALQDPRFWCLPITVELDPCWLKMFAQQLCTLT